ncbi:hypothetical protein SAMN05421858_1857 [Haladaptatus litoreus]|uniref:Uncharacterized protein n=1 Tax=Haladaptatus litoreus TaxID=553468 RepID=A0A1N6Z3Q1_9EURY|nr:hypothetical protein [Haladaptatus litoreus]SIR21502.1 hypothetical protein SAMN05421858_1857 [Haladaptatus litoreus]
MTISNRSSLVSFDVDSAVAVLKDVAGDSVHLCVEYDTEDFNALYVDQLTLDLYDSEREMVDHFEEVLSYVHVDFMEKDLFEEVFRDAGGVRSFATFMDHVTLVRMLVGEEGLFFTVDPDSDVTALVETVEDAIE